MTGEAIRVDGGLLAAGPRMIDLTDPYNTAQRYAGYADGTTGRPPEKRLLADEGLTAQRCFVASRPRQRRQAVGVGGDERPHPRSGSDLARSRSAHPIALG